MTSGDWLPRGDRSIRSRHHLFVDNSSHERDHFLIATEYYVNQASVPLGVAVFVCACGAKRVECEPHHGSAPEGWSVSADGTTLCPRCATAGESGKPES